MTDRTKTFKGLRTVIYGVTDLERAKKWYADAPFGNHIGIVENPHFDAKATS